MMFADESFPEVDAVFAVRCRIDESKKNAAEKAAERRRKPRSGGLTFRVEGVVSRGASVFLNLRARHDEALHFECMTRCEDCWWENGRWMISVRFQDEDAGLLQSIHTLLSLHLRKVELEGEGRKTAEG